MFLTRNWKSFSRCCELSPHGRRFISIPSNNTLYELGLLPSLPLVGHGDHNTRAAEGATRGDEKYMSSRDMYRHLNFLQELVPSGMRARSQIETILFRVSAMLQGDRRLVFGIRDGTFPLQAPYLKGRRTQTLPGAVGYNVLVADSTEDVRATQWGAAELNYVKPEGFFITESNPEDLWDRFPHAIAKLYAVATKYNIGVTRGAISNGHEWGFILVKLNENGRGGGYKSSPEIGIDFERDHPHRVMNRGPDIVAGVLAHWIERCYDDLDENDWFKVNTSLYDPVYFPGRV